MNIVAGANTLNVTMTLITGTLTGKVIDQNGVALPGVAITMTGPGGTASTTTAADGTYTFTGIIPGTYTITFVKAGYTTVTQ